MKTIDKFTKNVIDGFQKAKGNAYTYCFPPLTYIDTIKEIYNKFNAKWQQAKIFIIVKDYTTRCKFTEMLKEYDNITCLTQEYVHVKYRYVYNLTIFIDVDDDIIINHITSPFKLLIYTNYVTNKYLRDFLDNNYVYIDSGVSANDARKDSIYTPVEETQIAVNLLPNDRTKYNEYDNFITECMKIFNDLDTIEKCKHGDKVNNISAITIRDTIARNNGWSDDLDMNVEYLAQIDKYYNPNVLLDRANSFYRIRAEREQFVLNCDVKIDKILDIVRDNPTKKIIIVSKTGEFANKISNVINDNFGIVCDCYHNEIEDRVATDETGKPLCYKSGVNKCKQKVIKSQAISTQTNKLFNEGVINILSIKNSSYVDLNIDCDIMIITSPICDGIFDIKTRYKNLRFTTIPNKVYMLYCSSTIESKKLFERNLSNLITIISDDEKNYTYDENSGNIIL